MRPPRRGGRCSAQGGGGWDGRSGSVRGSRPPPARNDASVGAGRLLQWEGLGSSYVSIMGIALGRHGVGSARLSPERKALRTRAWPMLEVPAQSAGPGRDFLQSRPRGQSEPEKRQNIIQICAMRTQYRTKVQRIEFRAGQGRSPQSTSGTELSPKSRIEA